MNDQNQQITTGARPVTVPLGHKKAFAGKFKRREEITSKVEFKNEIFFTLAFLPRPELQKCYSDSQVMRMNKTTEVREPQTDPELFAEYFTQKVVRGWEGLTPRKLADLIDIDVSELTPEELDAPIPYNSTEMAQLFREAYDIDTFMQGYVTNLKNFRPHHEEETKNYEGSPNGS